MSSQGQGLYDEEAGIKPLHMESESDKRGVLEMVILGAARTITELSAVISRELTPAITILQLFLSSSKPAFRFATVRTINKVQELEARGWAQIELFGFVQKSCPAV